MKVIPKIVRTKVWHTITRLTIASFAEEEARFMANHRARTGGFGLSAMAGMLSSQAGQLKSLLASLREPDPSVQLIALNELATILSMSTEESLAGYIQTDAFVAELVNLMRGPNAFGEENPETMLLACRCLANLMEALPSSTANIAYSGAIQVLCQKLLEIQFIDLAEQALSTLEKISKEFPTSIVREGGLAACLTYLDFFSTNVQRIAVNTAANCAKNIPPDSFTIVRDIIPTLQNIIAGSDAKVVEAGCLCLTRIFESFRLHPDRLEELLQPDLLDVILNLLSPSGNTFIQTRFIHVLGICAKASAKLATLLVKQDAFGTIYQLVTGLSTPTTSAEIRNHSVVVLQALIHRPREQISEMLSLISEILPGLPEGEMFAGLSERERGCRDSRLTLLQSCAEQYERFAAVVLPTLMDIYNSTVNVMLRKISLVALLKLCYNMEPAVMMRIVNDIPLAVFVTGVLGSEDQDLALCGVRIASILLERVESIYARKLTLEGCVAEVEALHRRYSEFAEQDYEPEIVAEVDDDDGEEDEEDDSEMDEDDEAEMLIDEMQPGDMSSQSTTVPDPVEKLPPALVSVLLGRCSASFLEQYNSLDPIEDDSLAELTSLAQHIDPASLATLSQRLGQVSSYYLKSSGMLRALLDYLTNSQKIENRRQFAKLFLTTPALASLVEKLQELLSRSERFEVSTSSSNDEKRSANVLAKQLKLKLVADGSSDVPKPYRNLMVSIHAIATFKALDDYLRPRVLNRSRGPAAISSRAPEGLQGALAQLAAAGAALPDSIRERLAHLGVDTGAEEEAAEVEKAEESKPMSYAAAVSSAPTDWHISFEVAGQPVSPDTTIYGGIRNSQPIGDASTHRSPLSSVYLVNFKKVKGPPPVVQATSSLTDQPNVLQTDSDAAIILQLLDVLYNLKATWKHLYEDFTSIEIAQLSDTAFVNNKLTAKLNRQLEDPLIVASSCLPLWSQELPRFFPFLFPFETRYLFLQSTSFGYSRSMSRWQSAAKKDRDDSRPFLGRLQRQKVRILRTRMLESAVKVMDLYGASPSVLEVEYFEEVGTGLGPTLEFYSTVSKEFSKSSLNLWRGGSDTEYVFSPTGLFPRPHPDKRAISLFKTIGIFCGRAMIDSRLVDIPLNPAFFRIALASDDLPPSIGMIYNIDKSLARSLTLLSKFAYSYNEIRGDDSMTKEEQDAAIATIRHDKVRVEDLGLDFTYPGYPEIHMIEGDHDVTIENVSEYVDCVIDHTLGSGITQQIEAFKEGFSLVFPFTALNAFTPAELTMIFGHSDEDWSTETLLDSIKADHGYTMDSSTIRNLVHVLSNLSEQDRRRCLQFITGSPKLPIGGFKSLTPQFTVVCKPYEAPVSADDYLPSVMTCVNYLKLPDYSTLDILQTRLMTAITEGGGSFHLS